MPVDWGSIFIAETGLDQTLQYTAMNTFFKYRSSQQCRARVKEGVSWEEVAQLVVDSIENWGIPSYSPGPHAATVASRLHLQWHQEIGNKTRQIECL